MSLHQFFKAYSHIYRMSFGFVGDVIAIFCFSNFVYFYIKMWISFSFSFFCSLNNCLEIIDYRLEINIEYNFDNKLITISNNNIKCFGNAPNEMLNVFAVSLSNENIVKRKGVSLNQLVFTLFHMHLLLLPKHFQPALPQHSFFRSFVVYFLFLLFFLCDDVNCLVHGNTARMLQIYIVPKLVVCLFVFRLDNSEKLETIEIHRK